MLLCAAGRPICCIPEPLAGVGLPRSFIPFPLFLFARKYANMLTL